MQEYTNMLSAFWLLAAFVHRVSVSLIYFVVQCEDSRCHVWQHIGCVIIAEKPMEGVLPASPAIFYCELCRLTRADPYVIPVIFFPLIRFGLYSQKFCDQYFSCSIIFSCSCFGYGVVMIVVLSGTTVDFFFLRRQILSSYSVCFFCSSN